MQRLAQKPGKASIKLMALFVPNLAQLGVRPVARADTGAGVDAWALAAQPSWWR